MAEAAETEAVEEAGATESLPSLPGFGGSEVGDSFWAWIFPLRNL